jgi:2'-5' RNA ligase
MQSINLNKSLVSIIEEQIIHVHLKTNQEIELQDVQEIINAIGSLTKGKKFPVFIDAGSFININQDAFTFSASEAGNIYTLADAIAVQNLGQKLLANFYLKNDHPKVPTKVFTEKEEALTWLKRFKVKD